jgi:ribulose-phosphate 3-epimerase
LKIYPSLISSDLLNIRKTLQLFDDQCDGYHIDVMDGHFVPNLTWGAAFVNAIHKETYLPLHVHLMVDFPARWVDRLVLTSKDSLIFHIEALKDSVKVKEIIEKLKNKNIQAGLAVNPKTPCDLLKNFFQLLDEVLVMSVEPGFSGQSFIDVVDRIVFLCKLKSEKSLQFKISIDGGVGPDNIKMLAKAGVDIACVATAIFSGDSPIKNFNNLCKIIS